VAHFEFEWRSEDDLCICGQGWKPEGNSKGLVGLVHGLGEHSGRYERLGTDFAEAGCVLASFDLRGHGRSEGARGDAPSYEALLDDVGMLLERASELFPGVPQFLYGHSLGGGLVLNYALRRSAHLAGIIATSPWLRTRSVLPAWKMVMGRVLYRVVPALAMSNGVESKDLSHDPGLVYHEDPLVHDRVSARLGMEAIVAGEWALAHASEFALPLLLVHGDADPITSCDATQEFAARVPGDCTLKIWPGLYHETHNELNRDDVVAFTLQWIRAHSGVDR